MNDSSQSLKGQYLLAIEPIDPVPPKAKTDPSWFPAYFVGSTAPNNVERGVEDVADPSVYIKEIAEFLSRQTEEREILITVHGYNTSLGEYHPRSNGVKGWYQQIRNHIAEHYGENKPKGLVFLGYRWSSEVIKGVDDDTLGHKIRYAYQSLPVLLKILLMVGWVGTLLSLGFFFTQVASFASGVIPVLILSLALMASTLILTLILLRLSGYFRDSYRANHYGVPDLVELVRQLDQAIVTASPSPDIQPIKLSFIGHSMGGFAVTNAVRILSDVFDAGSIGSMNLQEKAKTPPSRIGHVFSLGRLVLVSPDIPAESIISGRANFLSSSLRRFEEAYLFSNEGDMALKLASTAANYFSFPANTRTGGYRLGNVFIRKNVSNAGTKLNENIEASRPPSTKTYGIVNLDPDGRFLGVKSLGEKGFEPKQVSQTKDLGGASKGITIDLQASSFLSWLFISSHKSLAERQGEILLSPNRRPIAELFTYFDCTDYTEPCSKRFNKKGEIGLLTRALGKTSLNFWDYACLTFDFATGKIDTHGGYFGNGDPTDPGKMGKTAKPEAALTKHLIYGLACLGFQGLLNSMPTQAQSMATPPERPEQLQNLSRQCEARGIEVLLAVERYNRNILGVETDREGY